MNFAKAQKEIFNGLLNGRFRLGRFNIGENHILVTPDPYRAFIFPISAICFNLEKIREMDAFHVTEIVKPENELKLTPDFRLLDHRKNLMCRRLTGNGKNTYVNPKFLECFQNPRFYQEGSNLGAIVITEGTKDVCIPVGIVLPIRCTWDDGNYYGDTGRM